MPSQIFVITEKEYFSFRSLVELQGKDDDIYFAEQTLCSNWVLCHQALCVLHENKQLSTKNPQKRQLKHNFLWND